MDRWRIVSIVEVAAAIAAGEARSVRTDAKDQPTMVRLRMELVVADFGVSTASRLSNLRDDYFFMK